MWTLISISCIMFRETVDTQKYMYLYAKVERLYFIAQSRYCTITVIYIDYTAGVVSVFKSIYIVLVCVLTL